MEAIITAISRQANIPEDAVRRGLRVLLQFINEKSVGTPLQQWIDQIPGARMMLNTPVEIPPGETGALSGLLSSAGAMFGGQSGEIAKVTGALQGAGIDLQKLVPFIRAFLDQAREKLPPEVMEEIFTRVPLLRKFADSEK